MSKENKVEIIKKEIDLECYVCDGTGNIKEENITRSCPICQGTGIFKDYIYFHIVNGICFSGDSLK